MSIADLLLPEYDQEMALTRTTLERVPDDDGEWRPHPKSFPIAHLAQLVSRMPAWVIPVLTQPDLDIAPPGNKGGGYTVEKTAKLLTDFDANVKMGRDAIAAATDAQLAEPWQLKADGHVVNDTNRYMMLRTGVINHIVHHRAQLGVYLRLRDKPVPSTYGPTADEKQ